MGQHPGRRDDEEGTFTVVLGVGEPLDVAFMRIRLAELELENRQLKQKLRSLAWDAIKRLL